MGSIIGKSKHLFKANSVATELIGTLTNKGRKFPQGTVERIRDIFIEGFESGTIRELGDDKEWPEPSEEEEAHMLKELVARARKWHRKTGTPI